MFGIQIGWKNRINLSSNKTLVEKNAQTVID